MGFLNVNIDKSEVDDWLDNVIGGMEEQAGYMVGGIVNVYELVSRYSSPVVTGVLMNSIISEAGGLSGDVIPTAFYSQWVILGRGPSKPNDFMQTGFDAANEGGEIDSQCEQFLDWCVA
jgi:hypothetical protein